VETEQHDLRKQLDAATQRLLGTAGALTDAEIGQPALLPGWTRGHVLAHLARNADALRNLLIWARTGTVTPAYASAQDRDDGINAGADRAAAQQLADLTEAAAAFQREAASLPDEAWQAQVRIMENPPFPAIGVLVRRLVEVELHHADLGAGYGAPDWPASFAALELPEPMNTQRLDRLRR
jgi:maleylpyruvate isomerase